MAVHIRFDDGSSTYFLEKWFVGEGVAVVQGQDLALVRADGKNQVVEAPMSGIFLAKRIGEDTDFSAEDTIGLILSHQEAGDIKVTDKLTQQDRRILDSLHNRWPVSRLKQPVHVKATPSARRIARENQVDLRKITGTGPDGRVQQIDVTHIVEQMQRKEVKNIDNKPVYNLPLTPLAEHLIREHGLDASRIPAPSGAKRLRKSDVERYLKNPEGAAQSIEEANREEEDLIASLEIPEPEVAAAGDSVETEEVLQIGHEEELRLTEPEEESTVIRLSTVEPVVIATGETIALGEEEEKEEETSYVRPTAHLSKLAVLDLKKLDVNKRKEDESILDYARGVILTTIVRALHEEGVPATYLPEIDGDYYSLSLEDGLKREKITREDTRFLIVDLLSSHLTEVSGLVGAEGRAVLYFSYVCQLSDLLGGNASTKSLLSLTLDFDTSVYPPERTLALFERIANKLETLDEVRR